MSSLRAYNGSNQPYAPEQQRTNPQDGAMEVVHSRLQQLEVAGSAVENSVAGIEARLAQRVPLQAEVKYVPASSETLYSAPLETTNPLFAQGNEMADEARRDIQQVESPIYDNGVQR